MQTLSPSGAPRTVLYAEDQAVHTLVMQSIFRHRPHLTLVCATTGIAALRRVASLEPSLLLLDLHLPDCHGAELLRRLRALPQCADIPAIVVTSDDSFDGRGHDFCDVWLKPVEVRRVLERLDQVLEHGTLGERSA